MLVKDKKRSCVLAPIYCFPAFQMLQTITAAVTRDNWNNFISCAGIWVCKWTRVSCQQNFKGKFKMAISVARHLRESVPPPPRFSYSYIRFLHICLLVQTNRVLSSIMLLPDWLYTKHSKAFHCLKYSEAIRHSHYIKDRTSFHTKTLVRQGKSCSHGHVVWWKTIHFDGEKIRFNQNTCMCGTINYFTTQDLTTLRNV